MSMENTKTFLYLYILNVVFLVFCSARISHASRKDIQVNTSPDNFEVKVSQTGNNYYLPLVFKRYPQWNVFGIEDGYGSGYSAIQKFVESGADWYRINPINWAEIEQTEGVYDWSILQWFEDLVLKANAEGFLVLPVVHKTPTWAQKISGYYCGPIKDDKIGAFANFMAALVSRYSRPPYNVKYWQIWNEPDADPDYVYPDAPYGCWADDADPYYGGGYYADVLKIIYPAIKAADPASKVVVGGLLMGCNPNIPPPACTYHQAKYLEGILRHNGAMDGKYYFDIVAFHAYSDYNGNYGQYVNGGWQAFWNNVGPVVIEKARFIKNVLNQYGASNKGLMATEIALRCGPGDSAPSCTGNDANFDHTKAFYLAEAYAASIAEGLQAGIYYSLRYSWRNTALLNPDLSDRMAFIAFKAARERLDNAEFVREITEYTGVKGYVFIEYAQQIWFLRSLDGVPHVITLPEEPSMGWDVFGNQLSNLTTTITTTIAPIYLGFDP